MRHLTADKYGVLAAICDMLFAGYVATAHGLHAVARKRPREEDAATYDDCVRGALWSRMGHLPAGLPAVGALFNVTLMGEAGLVESAVEMHYCRKETVELWTFMDDVRTSRAHYGYLQGLPGTVKSTGVWHWLMSTANHLVVWMHFDEGQFHVVLASGGEFTALKVLEEKNASRFVVSLPACYLVVDGLVIHRGCHCSRRGGGKGRWLEPLRGDDDLGQVQAQGRGEEGIGATSSSTCFLGRSRTFRRLVRSLPCGCPRKLSSVAATISTT